MNSDQRKKLYKAFSKNDFDIPIREIMKKKMIGRGGFGRVYQLNKHVAVKIIPLSTTTQSLNHLEANDINGNPWREVYILLRTNKLVLNGIASNIALMYAYKVVNHKLLLFMEMYTMNFRFWLLNPPKSSIKLIDQSLSSILMQTLHAYEILYKLLHFYQSDFEPTNILIKTLPTKVSQKLVKNNTEYFTPPSRFFAVLSDFGSSTIKQLPRTTFEKSNPITKSIKNMVPLQYLEQVINTVPQYSLLHQSKIFSILKNILYTYGLFEHDEFNNYFLIELRKRLSIKDILMKLQET